MKELNRETLIFGLSTVGLLALSLLGFSDTIKQQAREKQHGICPVCGQKLCKCVEGHHKLPKSLGGNNSLENCVMVDGDTRGGRDCHEYLDRKAIDEHLIFVPETHSFIPLQEVPEEQGIVKFRSGNIYRKEHHKHRKQSHRHGNHHR